MRVTRVACHRNLLSRGNLKWAGLTAKWRLSRARRAESGARLQSGSEAKARRLCSRTSTQKAGDGGGGRLARTNVRRRLGQESGCAVARRVPGNEACGARAAKRRRRFDNLDCVGRGHPRLRRTARLLRGEGRRSEPDAFGSDGIRQG